MSLNRRLLEDGSFRLLESGDTRLLENSTTPSQGSSVTRFRRGAEPRRYALRDLPSLLRSRW